MSEEPRGYKILSKQHTAKSELYFVRRWGRRYVVKEYTGYRFSGRRHGENMTDPIRKADKRAEVYFEHLKKVARLMRRSLRRDGLLNIPLDVFRQNRSIYKVTYQLDACEIEPDELRDKLSTEQMNVFLCTLLAQMAKLEEIGFIHCDIKPENVIICKKRDNTYSASVIDYDSGIIIADDDCHYVDYTPEYAAPEMCFYKANEEESDADELRDELTCAADMFSIACLIVQYLSGKMLGGEDQIPAEMLRDGRILWVPRMIHPVWRTLLKKALRFDPQRRLSAAKMLERVTAAMRSGLMKEIEEPFEGCPEGSLIVCGRERVRLFERAAWWYLDQNWMADCLPEELIEVRRRRARLENICQEVSAICNEKEALFLVQTRRIGHRFFIEQQLPEGKCERLRKIGAPMSVQEADRFMITLLKGVRRLHEKGYLCCLMHTDDVWCVTASDGSRQPVLSGLHHLVKADELPDREDIDIYPQIVSPEVCIYLGSNDDALREEVVEMISAQSDLFNLGAVYHVLLTGSLPYMDDHAFLGEAAGQFYEDRPSILLGASLDEQHRELIREMLSYEPEDRPESCEAVLAQIESFGCTPKRADGKKKNKKAKTREAAPVEAQVEEEQGWIDSVQQDGDVFYVDDDGLLWADDPVQEAAEEDELFWMDVEVSNDDDAETADLSELLTDDSEEAQREELLHQIGEIFAKLKKVEKVGASEDTSEGISESGTTSEEEESSESPKKTETPKKTYSLVDAEDFGGWRKARRDEDGISAWAHFVGRDVIDKKEHLGRVKRIARKTRQISKKCESIMPVGGIYPADGTKLFSITHGEHNACRSMADESWRASIDKKQIDEWMKLIVKGVQAAHESGLLCCAVTAENVAVIGNKLKINLAEQGVLAEDARDMSLWREWVQPWRLETHQSREKNAAGAYLSPEIERLLGGEELTLTRASDIFALGVLYHVLWCGQLPVCGSGEGSWEHALREQRVRISTQIPFAQRYLIERMLSYDAADRPQSCEEVREALENITLKRGKTHSVTVKREGVPVVGRKAWLYTTMDDKERFVAEAMTDRQGKAVFTGYLPEARYFVRCDGEKVNCRWRNF